MVKSHQHLCPIHSEHQHLCPIHSEHLQGLAMPHTESHSSAKSLYTTYNIDFRFIQFRRMLGYFKPKLTVHL